MARYTVKAIQAIAEVEGLQLEKLKNGYSIGGNFVSTLAEVKDWIDGYVEEKQLATTEAPDEIEENPNGQGTEDIQTTTDRIDNQDRVLANDLRKILTKASPVIAEKPVHPILGYVKLEASEGILTATSTNLSNCVVVKSQCPDSFKFNVCLPHNLICNWLKACHGLSFNLQTLVVEETDFLKFSNESINYQFKTLSSNEFPATPETQDAIAHLTFGYEGLIEALTAASKLASKDETKQVLTGVHVVVKDGLARIEACDGHIINKYQVKVDGQDCEFILSTDLIQLLKGCPLDSVHFKVCAEAIEVTCGELKVISRLLVGDYPELDKVTAKWADTSPIVVDAKRLKAAIKRCAGEYNKKDDKGQHLVWLSGDTKTSQLVINGDRGTEVLSAQIIGDFPDAAYLDSRLLLSILKGIPSTAQVLIKLGRFGLTSIEPVESNQIFALMAIAVALTSPIERQDDKIVVVRHCTYEDLGVTHSFISAEDLPYQRTDEGLIVTRNLDESYRDDHGYLKSFKEYQQAIPLPYEYRDGVLTVTQDLKEDWIEWSTWKGKGSRKNTSMSVAFAIAQPLPESPKIEIEAEKAVEEDNAIALKHDPIRQKLIGIRLPLLGHFWSKSFGVRKWTESELETLQAILLEWVDLGNTADSLKSLWDKFVTEVPKHEICNLIGIQARTDLIVHYTTAQDSYDGFGTMHLETLHKSDRGLPWRKVAIAPEHLEWQVSRYGSGIHPAFTQEEWDKLNQPKAPLNTSETKTIADSVEQFATDETEITAITKQQVSSSKLARVSDRLQADPIKQTERNIVGIKIPGFVPTPKPTVSKILEKAGIQSGMAVLEPSAGSGHIADEICKIEGVSLTVVERSVTLRELLEKKGYTLAGDDSLQHVGCYDRILLNPAWEDGHDIDEIQHCYINCLKAGGRMVAIASSGSTSRQDKKTQDFQNWLKGVNASVEALPDDAFVESGYNVRGVLIVIDKPETTSNVISTDDSEALQENTAQSEPESIPVTPRKLNKQVKAYEPALINYLEQQAKNGDTDAIALLEAITDPIVSKVKRQSSSRTSAPKVKNNNRTGTRSLSSETAKQEKWNRLEAVDRAIQSGTSAKVAAEQEGLPSSSIAAELAGYRLATKYPDLFKLWQTDITTWSNIRSAAQSFKSLGDAFGLAVARGQMSLKEAKSRL